MAVMAFTKECGVAPWEFAGGPKIYWFLRWCYVQNQIGERREYQKQLEKNRG